MIVRLLLLGTILCVTVLVSADGSIHDVVKRQAIAQRGRFRLRHPPTTEEASVEKTSAAPLLPPSLLPTGTPRRSRFRIRLRTTTVAVPEEVAPRVQPAVRTHPQSAPPEEEEEDEEDYETSEPHTDPPKLPPLSLAPKRPRLSFTALAAQTTKQAVKETPKPTIKIIAKQPERPPLTGADDESDGDNMGDDDREEIGDDDNDDDEDEDDDDESQGMKMKIRLKGSEGSSKRDKLRRRKGRAAKRYISDDDETDESDD